MKRIVVLGGGTGGTIAANRLRRVYGADAAARACRCRETGVVQLIKKRRSATRSL
jgi:NADH dehydrogenase FAD-containing subunit